MLFHLLQYKHVKIRFESFPHIVVEEFIPEFINLLGATGKKALNARSLINIDVGKEYFHNI